MRRAIVPSAMRAMHDEWRMSPAVEARGLLFLTGFSGASPDGAVATDATRQIETAFDQVEAVLAEAGASMASVVEVTSYHVGLRSHLPAFRAVWAARMTQPYPAWTAIEVAGLATEGVVVELRVVAEASA